MSTTIANDRFNMRINHDIKEKAQKKLAQHGLNLTDFIRSDITTIANFGLPDHYGMSDLEAEKYAAKHWKEFPKFDSVKGLMRYLNEK